MACSTTPTGWTTLYAASIHLDSTWVACTHFHRSAGKSGMSGERVAGKVIFETRSTHENAGGVIAAWLIHVKASLTRGV
ncbi:hypothetical protein ACNKHW_01250 [Shigella flexneri]